VILLHLVLPGMRAQRLHRHTGELPEQLTWAAGPPAPALSARTPAACALPGIPRQARLPCPVYAICY